jgi:hypothetical protein
MTQSDTTVGGPSKTEQLRHAIDETRAELGETVETLARKADVKTIMRDTLEEKRHAFTDQLNEAVTAARDIRDHFRNRRG